MRHRCRRQESRKQPDGSGHLPRSTSAILRTRIFCHNGPSHRLAAAPGLRHRIGA